MIDDSVPVARGVFHGSGRGLSANLLYSLQHGRRDQSPKVRGLLSWQDAAAVIAHLAQAVHQLHSTGKVHGLIGPDSVTLGPGGNLRLASVTVQSHADEPRAPPLPTNLGVRAPEHLSDGVPQIDQRTDVYGLGVLLYEILCGKKLFSSRDHLELRRQVLEDAPQPPRQLVHGIPVGVEMVCLRALAKDPMQRFQSAAEMAAALHSVVASDPSSLSSIHSAESPLPLATRPEWCLRVSCSLPGNSDPGIKKTVERLNKLLLESLQGSPADLLDLSEASLLAHLRTRSATEATREALGFGLRLVGRLLASRRDEDWLRPAAADVDVRVETTKRPANVDREHLDGADLEAPSTSRSQFVASVGTVHVELSRRTLELVTRWYECGENAGGNQWHISGPGVPNLNVKVRGTSEVAFEGRKSQLALL